MTTQGLPLKLCFATNLDQADLVFFTSILCYIPSYLTQTSLTACSASYRLPWLICLLQLKFSPALSTVADFQY